MGRRNNRGGWPPYVPVAQRRAQAKREVNKLSKKGQSIQPVEIEGRTIARSFWGKGWCTHLEGFSDYSNRLPRGRTYVRNGSVCHLGLKKGKVEAIVSGSELYHVKVDITPLKKTKWEKLKQHCSGQIGSLIELLQGKLSDEIMATVSDRQHGLFPLAGEIHYHCDCPDWADMCKHVAAVMYGIGARLDAQPELLFLLRGVNHEELIASGADVEIISGFGSKRSRRRALPAKDLESVFGVELDAAPKSPTPRQAATPKRTKKVTLFKPTARSISRLRHRLGMNQTQFAKAVGVSTTTIAHWEKAAGLIKPQARSLAGLMRLHAGER